jgi:hypothetical protein
MRKLRKKIYKHCVSKQKSKKQKDSTQEIIEIFRQRNVPEFVTDFLRKRRSFDVSSIKNILINVPLPLEEIRNRVNLQEREIDGLYFDHKQRMEEERRKEAENRPLRLNSLSFVPNNIYSSTNEDDILGSLEEGISVSAMEEVESGFCQHFEDESKEPMFTDNYLHLNESSFNSDLPFLNF